MFQSYIQTVSDTARLYGSSRDLLSGAGESGMISAIVPTFNRAHLVTDALDSLAAQTYRELQLIVVDDGSTDDTQNVVRAWSLNNSNVQLEYIHQQNKGVAAARNAGLALARGEFIYFLDSDDLIFPHCLSRLVATLAQNSETPFAVSHMRNADMCDRTIRRLSGKAKLSNENIFKNHWMTHSALYRRSTLYRSGPFLPNLRIGEDSELNWRIVATNGIGTVVDEILGTRRVHQYGHLSIGSDVMDRSRSTIDSRVAFADWLGARRSTRPNISFFTLCGFIALGIRAGRYGDYVNKDRSFALPRQFWFLKPRTDRLVTAMSRPNSKAYYFCLFAVLQAMNGVKMLYILVSNATSRR